MIRILTPALAGLAIVAGTTEITTRYDTERKLTVTVESSQTMETVASEITRDGEPMEGRGGGFGGGGTESKVEYTYTDSVLSLDDGAPVSLEREFGDVASVSTMGFGEESREMERTSPLDSETLSLEVDEDGDTVATLKGDDEPDNDAMLKGHSMTLPLDGLLPDGAVAEGESWEPEGTAVLAALGLDIQGALFPPEERSEGGDRGGRGGGGRGGFRRRGSGGGLRYLNDAEWETDAKLTDRTKTVDGLECVVIELTFEAEGDMPETNFGRGRDRSPSPWMWSDTLILNAAERLIDNTYEVEIEGELLFSVEEQRPVQLELEGEISLEMNTEREFGESSMTIYRLQEGTIEHSIEVTTQDS